MYAMLDLSRTNARSFLQVASCADIAVSFALCAHVRSMVDQDTAVALFEVEMDGKVG